MNKIKGYHLFVTKLLTNQHPQLAGIGGLGVIRITMAALVQ